MARVHHKFIAKLADHSIGRVIYKNKYAPKGIVRMSKMHPQTGLQGSDEILEVYPAYATESHHEHIAPFIADTVKDHRAGWFPAIYAGKIHGGRIDTDRYQSIAVFNQSNFLVSEFCFQHGEVSPGHFDIIEVERNNIFTRKYIRKPRYVPGTVCSLLTGGGGVNNFGHWMLDALPRIQVIKEAGWYDEIDKFIIPNLTKGFQEESLNLLGIPSDRIICGFEHTHIEADTIIVTSHPRPLLYDTPTWVSDFLRASFAYNEEMANAILPSAGKLIYIDRRDTGIRKVINEDEVMKQLESRGFKCLTMSDYNLTQKANMFREAELVVSVTGAGLTNLLFCPRNSQVLEVFGDFVDPFVSELAHSLNIQHSSLKVENRYSTENIDNLSIQDLDVKVDIQKLMDKIELLLN